MVLVDFELERMDMIPKDLIVILASFKSSEFTFLVLQQQTFVNEIQELSLPCEASPTADPPTQPSAQRALGEDR